MPKKTEPLILSIDTATEVRSVFVGRGAQRLALLTGDAQRASHSASLLSEIDQALHAAQVRLAEIDLFAAIVGPGSFTGVRAGLATIKAFAATLGRAVVGVPTLHAIARAARPSRQTVALEPAGRGEVFAQTLAVTGEGKVTELDAPRHLSPAAVIEEVFLRGGEVRWAGRGAYQLADRLRERARGEGIPWREESQVSPGEEIPAGGWTLACRRDVLAECAAALACGSYATGQEAVGAEGVSAIYVRPSDAELKKAC